MGERNRYILVAIAFATIAAPACADDHPTDQGTLSTGRPLGLDTVRTGKTRSTNPAIDGAFVCRNLAMVAFLTQQMTGKAAVTPNLSSVGCAFLPAGTPVTVEGNDSIPVIRGETLLGIPVRGVTDPAMVELDSPPAR
ncbi:hypothetical protein [Bradyrhizobium sp. JYMT SZCCT0428]|uniref:hypothetical protein n=1 Tax=Bradyrhizobium sp. JYMT SZCCT0428 TaxID=2807673 RepID=UPI001BABDC32|nr:hypothetical protein [Bradyrhizobium sp. JYMT SZCCT0428]MBR1151575.1 hypothetical protein [Bradyrhizobium sp. JYMT SZCCT0428]